MNILPINETTTTNFKARIITKGNWTPNLATQFTQNTEVSKLSAGGYDLIARMKSKRASIFDKHHHLNEKLYKLVISAIPEKPTFLDKCKNALGLLPTISVTNLYHRERSLMRLMDSRINAKEYSRDLDINLL